MSKPFQYPVATMRRAVEHYEAGWKPTRIRELLADEGYGSPSLTTIYLWVNPDYRQRHMRSMRERKARASAENACFRLPSMTEDYQQAFMERLRAEGCSYSSIARVCRVVFGASFSEELVRYRLRGMCERGSRHGLDVAA